jgi:hypothetical protein
MQRNSRKKKKKSAWKLKEMEKNFSKRSLSEEKKNDAHDRPPEEKEARKAR